MAQQFIVEGNDGYVLSALCGKVGLPIPVGGYEGKKYGKFVVDAGGISKLSDAIRDRVSQHFEHEYRCRYRC